MAGAVPSGSFRISPVDRLGRRIDPAVLAIAEEILPVAVAQGLKLLGDPAVVANLWEEAAAITSQRLRPNGSLTNPDEIRNVAGYLYICFMRKVNRVKRKQVVTVSLCEAALPKPAWADPSAQFDMKILVDEFLARCDSVTQVMFWLRMKGHSWEEIGRIYDMSPNAAKERVRYVFQQVREKLNI